MIDCFAPHFVDQRFCVGRRHYHYPIHYFFCLDERSFNSSLSGTYRIILPILGHFLFPILMIFKSFFLVIFKTFRRFITWYITLSVTILHTLHTKYLVVS